MSFGCFVCSEIAISGSCPTRLYRSNDFKNKFRNIFSGSDINTWKNDVAKFQKAQTFEGTPKCSVVRAGMKERFSKK